MTLPMLLTSFISFLVGLTGGIFLIRKLITDGLKSQTPNDDLRAWLTSSGMRMEEQSKSINERLDHAARYIGQVQKQIGHIEELGEGMKKLQEFLTNPKLRGNIGEQILKELLSQVLPASVYSLQYKFSGGTTVDAVIKAKAGLIPIDSKFPMENFRKSMSEQGDEKKKFHKEFVNDVAGYIRSISSKYIRVDEGTVDYALMYLPSETVYYEVVSSQDLYELSVRERVLPVSPLTFYAHLRSVLLSLEGAQMEERAKTVLTLIASVRKDLSRLDESVSILNRHVVNAYNQMGQTREFLNTIHRKVDAQSLKPLEEKSLKGES